MVRKTYDVEEISQSFGEVVEVVSHGGEVILRGADQRPMAKIVPFKQRQEGLHSGETQIASDFDAPLEDEFWLGDK